MISGRWRGPGWRVLDADPARIKTARDWITRIVAAHTCPVEAADAALVVSELFANAVMHGPAGGQVLVGYVLWRDGARIVVCDAGGASLPHLRGADDSAEGGRGLRVVDALAARWESFRIRQGQVVWCDLGQPMHAGPGEAWAWLSAALADFPCTAGPGERVMTASGVVACSVAGPSTGPRSDDWAPVGSAPRLSLAAVKPEERTRRLETLAAELAGRDWTAHLTQPPNRMERLFVRHPSRREQRGYVLAAPDDQTGHWCYWLAASEWCIAPADEPVTAATAAIRHLEARQASGQR